MIINDGQKNQMIINNGQKNQMIINDGQKNQMIINNGQKNQMIINDGQKNESSNEGAVNNNQAIWLFDSSIIKVIPSSQLTLRPISAFPCQINQISDSSGPINCLLLF